MEFDDKLKVSNLEILEKITYITRELDDIVDSVKWNESESAKTSLPLPTSLQSIFKYLVIQNIIKGRLSFNIYFLGKRSGLASQIKTQEDLRKKVEQYGLGQLEIKEFSDNDVTFELKNGISSQDVKNVGRPVCYYEAGFFGGVVQSITGSKVYFQEVQCQAEKGGDCCIFTMLKPGEEIKIEGVTIPLQLIKEFSQENVKLLTSLAAHSIAAIENALVFETTRKQSLIDALTETYNHRFFQQMIRNEFKRAVRHKMNLSLIMSDIDHFKEYNDQYSHSVGDQALRTIAQVLKKNTRDIDHVCRYGGDEFTLILPQTDQQGAMVVAERINAKVKACRFRKVKVKQNLSISMGIASFIPSKDDFGPQEFIDNADRALLEAKATNIPIRLSE